MKYLKIFMMLMAVTAMTACSDDEGSVAPVNITINGKGIAAGEVTLKAQESLQLQLALYPTHASSEGIVYKSDDENIATVSGTGLVKALNDGSTTITVSCNAMPKIYYGYTQKPAVAKLKVNVIGNTMTTNDDAVSQDQADSRVLDFSAQSVRVE